MGWVVLTTTFTLGPTMCRASSEPVKIGQFSSDEWFRGYVALHPGRIATERGENDYHPCVLLLCLWVLVQWSPVVTSLVANQPAGFSIALKSCRGIGSLSCTFITFLSKHEKISLYCSFIIRLLYSVLHFSFVLKACWEPSSCTAHRSQQIDLGFWWPQVCTEVSQ